MKCIYLILATISFNINSLAQTMTVEGYKFTLNNKEYSPKEILPFMKNTNAYINAVNAKSKRHDSFILAGIAVATTGIVTAKVLKENTFSFYFTPINSTLMLGALICAGFAIKVNIRGKEYAQEAVQHYNKSLKMSHHSRPESQIFLGATNEGIGLHIRF